MNVNTIDLTPEEAKAILADGRLILASRDEIQDGQAAITERDALRARVAELEAAITVSIEEYAGDRAHCAVCNGGVNRIGHIDHNYGCVVAGLKAVIAHTPEQSIGAIKAAALRGLEPLVETIGNEGDQAIYWSEIEAESERLEKEAEHG